MVWTMEFIRKLLCEMMVFIGDDENYPVITYNTLFKYARDPVTIVDALSTLERISIENSINEKCRGAVAGLSGLVKPGVNTENKIGFGSLDTIVTVVVREVQNSVTEYVSNPDVHCLQPGFDIIDMARVWRSQLSED